MTTLQEKAYAKINLTLDVLGKRPDGYHDLMSVMQTVSFCDDVQIDVDTGIPWRITCGRQDVPADETNLAWKAAACFLDAADLSVDGISIRINKRIPSQAGLGGGSADASAVLRALNRHYGAPFTLEELAQLGAQVGSDVPFCVYQGTAMAEGRGERLRRLTPMPDCCIVICKPDFSASTPALFRKIDSAQITLRPDNRAMEQALSRGDLHQICACVHNVFDPVVAAEHPQVEQIKTVLRQSGALAQQMTGSGSAIFGIMPDVHSAETAKSKLEEQGYLAYLARPV